MDTKKTYITGIDMDATGKRIGQLIDASGLTDKELAQRMALTVQSINKWRHGHSLPDLENIYILSRIMGVKVDDLLVSRIDDGVAAIALGAKHTKKKPEEDKTEEDKAGAKKAENDKSGEKTTGKNAAEENKAEENAVKEYKTDRAILKIYHNQMCERRQRNEWLYKCC